VELKLRRKGGVVPLHQNLRKCSQVAVQTRLICRFPLIATRRVPNSRKRKSSVNDRRADNLRRPAASSASSSTKDPGRGILRLPQGCARFPGAPCRTFSQSTSANPTSSMNKYEIWRGCREKPRTHENEFELRLPRLEADLRSWPLERL